MIFLNLTFIFTFLLVAKHAQQQIITLENIHLSQYTLRQQWATVENLVRNKLVTQIVFHSIILTKQAFLGLMERRQVYQNLQNLSFRNVSFNRELFQTVWRSKVIQQLKDIQFSACNLQSDDLQIFKSMQDIELRIQRISFSYNFIGQEGIYYFSLLRLNQLKSLNLDGLSLVTNQSINYLQKLNLNNLTELYIGHTGISDYNAIRLFKHIDFSKLIALNISANNFEGTFFRYFFSKNFTSLRNLTISSLLIDEDSVQFLMNCSFPSLMFLQIGQNQLFVDQLYKFLNRNNYPKLQCLKIQKSVFDQHFFRYLAGEFEQNKFLQLTLNGNGINSAGIHHICSLDLSEIQILKINQGITNQQTLKALIGKYQYKQLRQLDLKYTRGSDSILQKILGKKWQKLQKIVLDQVQMVNLQEINAKQKLFPQLKSFSINARYMNSQQLMHLIRFISKNVNNFVTLSFKINNVEHFLDLIAKGYLNNLQNGVKILISQNQMLGITFNIQTQIAQIKIQEHSIQKAKIIKYLTQKAIKKSFRNRYLNFDEEQFSNFLQIQHKNILHTFSFLQAEAIFDYANLSTLSTLSKQCIKRDGKYIMPSTTAIQISNLTKIGLDVFNSFYFPNLNSLRIEIGDNFTLDPNMTRLIECNYANLISFTLIYSGSNIQNKYITNIFQEQQFISLFILNLQVHSLKSDDLYSIFSTNRHIRRIKVLILERIDIRKQINFLTQFRVIPKILYMNYQIVSDIIPQLAYLNLQFLQQLRLMESGVDNQKWIEFLDNLNNISQHDAGLPKLKVLILFMNYLQTSGVKQLFQFGMPNLQFITLAMNKDPNILNTILGSSKSHRLQRLDIYQNQQDSIDPNLNYKNSRHLTTFITESNKLQKIDFQILRKFDFRALIRFIALFSGILECQTLQHILKIGEKCNLLLMEFEKSVYLDSSCLKKFNSSLKLRGLSQFFIICQEHIHTNLRDIFDYIQFDNNLEQILLEGVYPPKSFFQKLSRSNINHLSRLQLSYNDLEDSMIEQILNRDLRILGILSLRNNPELTQRSLKNMKDRKYDSLYILDLSFTMIGDLGIQYLASCQFPNLKLLKIVNTEITVQSLILISKFKAKYLNIIDISSNNLSLDDLLKLHIPYSQFPNMKTIIIYPSLRIQQYSKLLDFYNKDRPASKPVSIQTNILYNLNDDQNVQ